MSKIEWTEETYNPFVGCTKISEGCKNCYAETMANRLGAMYSKNNKLSYLSQYNEVINDKGKWNGKTVFVPYQLRKPYQTKKPTKFFVCSMSDLFHENNSFHDILKVWDVMCENTHHIFQVLTKRPERMLDFYKWLGKKAKDDGLDSVPSDSDDYLDYIGTPDHIWIGITIENQEMADKRIPILLDIPAKTRFLSCEPLLGDIIFPFNKFPEITDGVNTIQESESILQDIQWVIIGGESGSNARPMHPQWAKNIIAQCEIANVSVFFKQWGEYAPYDNLPLSIVLKLKNYIFNDKTIVYKVGKKKSGNIINGKKYEQYPK